MKKKISIIVLFFCIITFAQKRNKIFVNSGLSFYSYMTENQNNFNISVNFIHQTKKENWSMEYYYLYSQNDNFPDFFSDTKAVDRFILSGNPETIFEDTKWDRVKNLIIGTKVHYGLFKSKRMDISCNVGLDLRRSYDKQFRLFKIETDSNNVTYMFGQYVSSGGGFDVSVFPGVHTDYNFGNNFMIALDGGYHYDFTEVTNDGTFWNFSLGIGKRF